MTAHGFERKQCELKVGSLPWRTKSVLLRRLVNSAGGPLSWGRRENGLGKEIMVQHSGTVVMLRVVSLRPVVHGDALAAVRILRKVHIQMKHSAFERRHSRHIRHAAHRHHNAMLLSMPLQLLLLLVLLLLLNQSHRVLRMQPRPRQITHVQHQLSLDALVVRRSEQPRLLCIDIGGCACDKLHCAHGRSQRSCFRHSLVLPRLAHFPPFLLFFPIFLFLLPIFPPKIEGFHAFPFSAPFFPLFGLYAPLDIS
mmetsp:Transcript_16963/g.25242  ORF Transcript_16963/g.25242 Transcript_16963/m.25242 type:complete len:253 (-) Transcript_16963:579-1337(-)